MSALISQLVSILGSAAVTLAAAWARAYFSRKYGVSSSKSKD